jgi:Fic family protein
MKPDPNVPFDNLPDLFPARELETPPVLKAIIGAREALSELNNACRKLPNPEVLMSTIPMLEAKDSSEIENVITTADELFQYDARKPLEDDNGTKEAYNYCIALKRGLESLKGGRPVCTNTALEVANALHGTNLSIRSYPVALKNAYTGEIYYTPPADMTTIERKLLNWERFINGGNGLDPLTKIAMSHYQFEAIHPFRDGNGRTGRILNLLLLAQYGFLDAPVLYLSRYILREKSRYYNLLRTVTYEEKWEEWILFILSAIHQTAIWTNEKICTISELMEKTRQKIQNAYPKIYSEKLMNILFAQPYCKIRNFVDQGVAERQTAAKYIDRLIAIGILREHPQKGPEKLYVHCDFLDKLRAN